MKRLYFGAYILSISMIYMQGGPLPTSYKWSYKPYKWPYKWVTGVTTLLIRVITPFITSRGPTLCFEDSIFSRESRTKSSFVTGILGEG